jgi:uncharacterized protein
MAAPENSIRILSIDGGGMRGIIPAMILKKLEDLIGGVLDGSKRPRQPLATFFDIIAGTSTGAIIAAGLAGRNRKGQPLATPDSLIAFYEKNSRNVFGSRRKILPRSNQQALAQELHGICGEARLSEATANLVVPAFVENGAFLFRGGPDRTPGTQADYLLRDVLLAATAAPTVFPPVRITAIGQQETRSFIDGGLFANNPTLHAWLDARELFGQQRDILVVSLGTGNDFRPVDYHLARNWGLLRWLDPRRGLVQLLMQGQSHDTHRNLQQLIPDQHWYIRLDPRSREPLPSFFDASDRALGQLIKVTNTFIDRHSGELADLSQRLAAAGPRRPAQAAGLPSEN